MEKVPFNKVFTKEEIKEATKFWSRDKKALTLIYAVGILAIFITIFICYNSAYSYNRLCYKSEISPEVFLEWEITERFKVNESMETVRVKNPSSFTRIKEVKMELFDNMIIAYCYWIGGTLYRYELDFKTKCYETAIVLKFE